MPSITSTTMVTTHSSKRRPSKQSRQFHSEGFYTRYLSTAAKTLPAAPIRGKHPLEGQPNIISLLAGKPDPHCFPFTNINFTARSPNDLSTEETYTISGSTLAESLQYSATGGMAQLQNWMYGLQALSHGRKKGEGWAINIGAGSQDLLYKALHALIDEGDPVLLESPSYAGILPVFQMLGSELIPVETDSQGISVKSLRKTLEEWPLNKRKPKILYTVPYGGNPNGATAPLSRRIEVLQLARVHNLLILEDDPYYYLYYGSLPPPPSYFALEAEVDGLMGHVLRFDSFSKILSAGLRIGVVSGPEPLVRAIEAHTALSNLQVSSLTQVMTYTLLSSWGYEGFFKHCCNTSAHYRLKRDVFQKAMMKHLLGLADWVPPESGMFFWFKLRLPVTKEAPEGDCSRLVETKAVENGVLVLQGEPFYPQKRKTAYVRAAFSLLEEDRVNEALRRLATVVRHELSLFDSSSSSSNSEAE